MSSAIIARLPELQRDSGTTISSSIIHGLNAQTGNRLITVELRGGKWVYIANPTLTLQYSHKRMTLNQSQSGFMSALNQSLKGGTQVHPVLMMALGGAVGFAGPASILFGVVATGVDMSRRDSDVLARLGDEIWAYEAIGKIRRGRSWVAQHVASYFLYDPFRANRNSVKGWLLHESRVDVIIE